MLDGGKMDGRIDGRTGGRMNRMGGELLDEWMSERGMDGWTK